MAFVKSRCFFSAHELEVNVFKKCSELLFMPHLCQDTTLGMYAKVYQGSQL